MSEPTASATLCHVARTARILADDDPVTAHVAVGADDHWVMRVVSSDGPCPAIGGVLASDGTTPEPEGWQLITDRGAQPVQMATARFRSQSVGVALQAPPGRRAPAGSLAATAELAARALHGATSTLRDSITGAMSRRAFADDLDARLRRSDEPVAILLCTVDSTDAVIDSLGWSTADALLRVAYERLGEALPAGTPIAHLWSNEFAVVVGAVEGPLVADRVVAVLSSVGVSRGSEVPLRASVGLADRTANADAETLLRQAHLAARRARQAGGGQWARFTGEWQAAAVQRLASHRDLGHAVERGQLRLRYQPVMQAVAAGGFNLVGVEALLRWEHPARGLIHPAEFVPVAEETGLIVPIGRWVLREACRRHVAWQHDAPRALGVNISAVQLASGDLVDDVRAALQESGLAPSSLVLEVTETSAAQDLDLAAARLADLRQLGVHVALDDFGTGYSSLTHLQRLPATILKLDRSFVAQIGTSGTGTRMAEAVLSLARTLGLDTVAEGVERPEQVAALRRLGCEFLQGFCLHRPLEADAVDALLQPESLGA